MRIVVVGASGQLGGDLTVRLRGDVVPLTHAELDLAQSAGITGCLDRIRPDVVVNCAAYNLVDRAEAEPQAAFEVNAWGVRALAAACEERDLYLVHFSTNYVFGLDEPRQTPYREADVPGPVSAYGVGKLAGEYFVRALCGRHLVIRTSALFGHRGKGNFAEMILRRAGEGLALRVVNDQVCTPTSTADLADVTIRLMDAGQQGLFHWTNAGSTSWYDYARNILEQAGMKADLKPVSSREFGAAARRPAYSVLAVDRYRSLGLPEPRAWQEALGEYLRDRR